MLVVILGTQASGSTWLFNAVRSLFALANSDTVSLSSDRAAEVLNSIGCGQRDVIVKSHALDHQFLSLLSLLPARIIVSTRDPRDSVVSQTERFSLAPEVAAGELARAFATIAMLDRAHERLTLRYEDRFTEDRGTIASLAQFLGIVATPKQVDAIFAELRPAMVRGRIERWLASLAGTGMWMHDPTTHWHPNHVGDGQVGKWRDRLEPGMQHAVAGCLEPLRQDGAWRRETMTWAPDLFRYGDADRGEAGGHYVACDGGERLLVYGPYLHLPVGRWRVVPLLEACPLSQPLSLKLDIHIPTEARGTVQLRTAGLPSTDRERWAMEFDHTDHMDPIEVRLSSAGDGRCGRFLFFGAEVSWLGGSELPRSVETAPVSRVG